MNASLIRKTILSAALVAGVAALPIATVSAQDSASQTVPDKAADGWITTKVKSELASTKGIKSTDVSVETNDGVVTLSGTIDTAAGKTKAEHVAKKVKGVKSVSADGLTVSASK